MYEVYTDGSCLGNPGRGGWAAISNDFKLCGSQPNTTNNIMEMTAIIKALEQCIWMEKKEVCIITDSNYVKQGITSWIHNWKKNGWRTAAKKEVKNKELWIELDSLIQIHSITWDWVKGHSGHPENERADLLANVAIEELK